MGDVTDRVVEQCAVLLCYAGFHNDRDDTPESYWASISESARSYYRKEARHWVAAWRGADWYLVPRLATPEMLHAAQKAGAGVRSNLGAGRVWRDMLDAVTKPKFSLERADG